MDHYLTLGVLRHASEAEIKKAYRALVKEVHPDSGNPGDIRRFHAIQEAYEVLSDETQRRAYDIGGSPVSWTGGFEQPLTPFRELRPRPAPTSAHLDIVLSRHEALRGGEVVLEASHERTCDRCAGKGLDFFGWCSECRGEGWLQTRERIRFRVKPGLTHGDTVTSRASDGRLIRAQIRIK
jgi:DnaJ-class molecular chaperone